jgi:hypothetical protein
MMRMLSGLLVSCMSLRVLAQDVVPETELPPESEPVAPHLAFADASDPNPGSGRGQILAGWIATGVGIAGVAQSPLCKFEHFDRGRELRRCRNVGLTFGVLGLALGIPWLVFGYQRRAAQKAWKKRHGLAQMPTLDLNWERGGVTFQLRTTF